MNVVYKFKPSLPYSLHDMRVSKIEIIENNIRFHFDYGYLKLEEPFCQIDGSILIENIDFDCSDVYFLSDNGAYGNFNGKKIEFLEFIKTYKDFSFEIIDEMYGYNLTTYSGYLSLPNRENLIYIAIYLYYTGNIVYEVKE